MNCGVCSSRTSVATFPPFLHSLFPRRSSGNPPARPTASSFFWHRVTRASPVFSRASAIQRSFFSRYFISRRQDGERWNIDASLNDHDLPLLLLFPPSLHPCLSFFHERIPGPILSDAKSASNIRLRVTMEIADKISGDRCTNKFLILCTVFDAICMLVSLLGGFWRAWEL